MHQLLLIAILSSTPTTETWTPVVQQRIASVATHLLPDALASQLSKHSAELRAGAIAPLYAEEPTDYHELHADGSVGRAPERVEQQVTKLVTMLHEHVPFKQVVYEFGVLSHYVADCAAPLASSAADPKEQLYTTELAMYIERNLKKYPPVFDGYFPFNSEPFNSKGYLQAVAHRANRFYLIIGQEFFPDENSELVSSSRFDDRSPMFGIAQLSFNHAVSAVANIWLFVWREANGDMRGAGGTVSRGGSENRKSSTRKRP